VYVPKVRVFKSANNKNACKYANNMRVKSAQVCEVHTVLS